MQIAAMVCGIVGLVLSIIPCLGMYAGPVALIGVVLGAMGMKGEKGKGMAVAGLVCGIIGTLIAAYWLYVWLTFKDEVEKGAKRFEDRMEEKMKEELEKELKKELSK